MSPIDDTIDAPELIAHVCVKNDWIPAKCVQFIDIEEDSQGFDVMTFEFEGQRFASHVQLRPIPN